MRVLITRPIYATKGLVQQLEKIQVIPELFPTINLLPTFHQEELKLAVDKLNTVDMAIFVSRAAVQFAMAAIKKRWIPLPTIQWAAIGPGTAGTLQQYTCQSIIFPSKPPYETEALIALKDFQAIANKRIVIFRGNGGRGLLSQVLQERGARVQLVEAYQRTLPFIDIVEKLTIWRQQRIDAIVTTSAECLHNLLLLIGPNEHWIKELPLVVVGLRMYELANKLEFKRPIIAPSADDTSIIKVLEELKRITKCENSHF